MRNLPAYGSEPATETLILAYTSLLPIEAVLAGANDMGRQSPHARAGSADLEGG
jgi:hypothetical protein